MRVIGLFTALFLMWSSISFAQILDSKMDSLSYGIGVMVGESFKREGIKDINTKLLTAAMEAAINGDSTLLNPAEANGIYREAINEIKEKEMQAMIAEGQAYLEENASKPGVVTTASGLQYEVINSGDGPKPTASDTVTTHYHGMLIDGTVFDSSVERGEPLSFPVGQVIKGWQEALQLMSVGDKWRIVIPHDLAYGKRGAGQNIPPYATLVFEVELLDIN